MKKVLLTGATELIGTNTIDPLLNLGFEVFAVTCSYTRPPNKRKVHWIQADLLNFDNIHSVFKDVKAEYLLHLDWYTPPTNRLANDVNFYWFLAGLEMLKQFNRYGGKRAVYAGTCFEYEMGNDPLNEFSTKLNPQSNYAKYKNHLNEIATLYSSKNNINFGWGRLFYIYGFNDLERRVIPHIIKSLLNDTEVVVSANNLVRDYMFACDIGVAFAKFLDTDLTGNVNICSNIPVKLRDFLSLIPERLNKMHLVKFEETIDNEIEIILGDSTRLTQEVGFRANNTLLSALNNLMIEYNLTT